MICFNHRGDDPVIPRRRKNRVVQGWSKSSRELLKATQAVVASLRPYWPLTVRQVYYQLVASGVLENHQRRYKALVRLLAKARIQELIPWSALEDRGREALVASGWYSTQHFIDEQIDGFLWGYRLDPQLDQPVQLEVWCEKDAVSRVIYEAAYPFGVPVYVCRGYTSATCAEQAKRRLDEHREFGQSLRVLYFGDLDPSGWDMPESIEHVLRRELGVREGFSIERCGLLPEHVDLYGLPVNPSAIKERDSRAKAYFARFGDLAVELDALAPGDLQQLVQARIQANLDMEVFEATRWRAQEEKRWIDTIQPLIEESVRDMIEELGGDYA